MKKTITMQLPVDKHRELKRISKNKETSMSALIVDELLRMAGTPSSLAYWICLIDMFYDHSA